VIDILNQFWRAFLYWDGQGFSGLAVTLWLLDASLFIGFILAVPLAVARISKNKFLSVAVWCYTYVFRGTPLYVQLLLIYTGLYGFEFVRSTEVLSAVFRSGYYCSIIAFALNTCAYTTEIFAGAMRTTNHGEIEAARAYGMSWFTMYRRIVIPSALRRSLPQYGNEVILMLHATSVAFTATVPDILKVARDANAATYQSFQSFGIAALLYLAVSFALVALFRQAEQRWLAYLAVRPH